ncbi:sensor histidine kinase [Tenuifilum thalassicum]|uniref:histidine kinase n=1 Tax=Tenuifilum thalassicum TaxID=2590900 RepID=A0A7D3XLH0_9BACT|nr:sensor histidine kinase [Tenuifilum thalassicum]QKG80455.1 hypothetical protein FHG85_09320 [Tenuifilum thalassicum]
MDKKTKLSLTLPIVAAVLTACAFIFLYFYIGIYQRENSYEDSKWIAIQQSRNAATEINSLFLSALYTLRSIAKQEVLIRNEGAQRDEVMALLRRYAKEYPQYLAFWTMWEPNKFDGKDWYYKNTPYFDTEGHFTYACFHFHDSLFDEKITAPEEYLENYYTIPKETKREMVLEPYYYSYSGLPKVFYETSVIVPIIIDTTFYGIVGIDIDLNRIQQKLKNLRLKSGTVSLIASTGEIVAHDDSSMIGENIYNYIERNDTLFSYAIKSGIEYSYETTSRIANDEVFRVLYPIGLNGNIYPWYIMVEISKRKATFRSINLYYVSIGVLIVGMLLITYLIFNIFERIRYEKNLINAKERAESADKLKTLFLHNLSHEIRTPLNAIIGFTQLLLHQNENLDEEQKESVKIIKKSSDQLNAIINDIIAISSLETGLERLSPSPTNLSQLIDDIQGMVKISVDENKITINTSKSHTGPEAIVLVDKIKLRRIINNLLSNAVKFTKEGTIEFGYSINNDVVEFFVSDTGIGIDSSKLELIFEQFTQADEAIQTQYGGTGIGLSICKGYVELMHGKIWVKSELGKGATFFFTVPYKPVTVGNRLIL